MSSIFLWKGCCVGVAAETETVDELCATGQYAGRSFDSSVLHTMIRLRRSITSSDVHQEKWEAARPRSSVVKRTQSLRAVRCRKVCCNELREENSSSLPSALGDVACAHLVHQ
jgi:hypothetical protein